MNVDEMDKAILEYVANEEPWHILCGAFCHRFDKPMELIQRVFRLHENGLVSIAKGPSTTADPTPDSFRTEAEKNNWFEDDCCTGGPWWNIVATGIGFEYVKDRFEIGEETLGLRTMTETIEGRRIRLRVHQAWLFNLLALVAIAVTPILPVRMKVTIVALRIFTIALMVAGYCYAGLAVYYGVRYRKAYLASAAASLILAYCQWVLIVVLNWG